MRMNQTGVHDRSGLPGGIARIAKKKVHTHYDNLRTSRNAPDEVIRAAYKALSQKYHPDKNPRPDAARIMAILNTSYAVLSDQGQRRRHDEWIAEQEGTRRAPPKQADAGAAQDNARIHVASYQQVEMVNGGPFWRNWRFDAPSQLAVLLCGVLALTIVMFSLLHEDPVSPLPALMIAPDSANRESHSPMREAARAASKKSNDTAAVGTPGVGTLAPFKTVIAAPMKIRFGVGPDGRPWPMGPRLYRDGGLPRSGQSIITIDNSHNAHPVYVKIGVDARPGESELYIPRHRLFSLENLPPGVYRLKYRDLQTGAAAQSNPLLLGDIASDAQGQQGALAIALRAMPSDTRDFHPIPESQF
ncbi:MAG TPA: J domain-containing protein [Oxalicibacterium sp.]|jgi:hypothetical protein|nr:J domain-containing protein [Oxalicibacterium sp.]